MAGVFLSRTQRVALLAAVMLVFLHGVCAADDWSITTSDFATQPVQLQSLSSDGLNVEAVDSKSRRVIPLDQFVSLHRTGGQQQSTAAFTLSLVGGDRLVGSPGPVVHEKLSWVSPSFGTMMVPFNRLALITKGLNLNPPDGVARQDVVTLGNGDTVAGVFTDCQNNAVSFQTEAGMSSIPLDNIRRIAFAAVGPAVTDHTRAYRLHLMDGSLLTVPQPTLIGENLTITLPGKELAKFNLPLASVLGIEQLNGPINWLSSLQPTEETQTPYFSGARHWPARFDTAVDGSPLSFDGQIYDHGLGVHAYSRLSFAIDPQWKIFRTQYAIDSPRDQPRRYADVMVRVLLDGKVVHEQNHFREGVLSPVVMINLGSAKTLTLECDYGNTGDTQAHLDWLQPAFVRAVSPVTASTAPTSQPDHE